MKKERNKSVTLLSETDRYGTIIFANDAFCETSKYTNEELIGKPHNIIRHPDMPRKLFELCWTTIKKGESFRAIIKNRAKDGSHYWVQTTIMPILDANSNVIKYIGVRHLVNDEASALEQYEQQIKSLGL